MSRVLGLLLSLVVGLVIGLAGAFVQAQRLLVDSPWGVVPIPWGVLLVWIALVAAIRGATWGVGTRWAGWTVFVGWLISTIVLSADSPSGDVALSGGGRQMTYLLAGVVIASAAASLPLPRSADRRRNP
jgi:hypothetical protein